MAGVPGGPVAVGGGVGHGDRACAGTGECDGDDQRVAPGDRVQDLPAGPGGRRSAGWYVVADDLDGSDRSAGVAGGGLPHGGEGQQHVGADGVGPGRRHRLAGQAEEFAAIVFPQIECCGKQPHCLAAGPGNSAALEITDRPHAQS